MNPNEVLLRLRRFLLALSALIFGGALVELSLTNHVGDVVQLIPFALCGMGLLAGLAVLFRPRRTTVLGLRACMAVVVGGSLYGVYEHVENNIAFRLEINPKASTGDVLMSALGGPNPLLAPGILAIAALIALAVTLHHPSQENHSRN